MRLWSDGDCLFRIRLRVDLLDGAVVAFDDEDIGDLGVG